MSNSIKETNFNFPNQTKFYKGKVRDVYTIGSDKLVMVVSDRISALMLYYQKEYLIKDKKY